MNTKKLILLISLFCFNNIISMQIDVSTSVHISPKDYVELLKAEVKRNEIIARIQFLEQRKTKYTNLAIGLRNGTLVTDKIRYEISSYVICAQNIQNKINQLYKELNNLPSLASFINNQIKKKFRALQT